MFEYLEAAFGRNLHIFRKDFGITQAELAIKLNVTVETIERWERGEIFPVISIVEQIAELFNIDSGFFWSSPEERLLWKEEDIKYAEEVRQACERKRLEREREKESLTTNYIIKDNKLFVNIKDGREKWLTIKIFFVEEFEESYKKEIILADIPTSIPIWAIGFVIKRTNLSARNKIITYMHKVSFTESELINILRIG